MTTQAPPAFSMMENDMSRQANRAKFGEWLQHLQGWKDFRSCWLPAPEGRELRCGRCITDETRLPLDRVHRFIAARETEYAAL
jgi:hypothetical protein